MSLLATGTCSHLATDRPANEGLLFVLVTETKLHMLSSFRQKITYGSCLADCPKEHIT